MHINSLKIELDGRGYDISIGKGLLGRLDAFLPFSLPGRRIFIVTDDHVERYAEPLVDILNEKEPSFCEVMVLPHGEATKSYENLQRVQGWMLQNNIHRDSLVIAVGGGVVGDLAGFAAATILRGVPFIQVPTTLLAQVDSSVGGRQGLTQVMARILLARFISRAPL